MRPTPQRVRVEPVVESERVIKQARQRVVPSTAPIRCQLWDGKRFVTSIPVTLDDMGRPSDVVYNPTEVQRVTKLVFLYEAKTFVYPIDPVIVKPGNPLHLALGHMKLLEKFGTNALKAGERSPYSG